jgi:hypothetical protein
MKAEEQTKLNETLSKVFKLDTEQLATLYNEAGDLTDLTVVTEADTKRVAKFNTEKTAQYNRGIKEGAGKIEKELKEKYEVESDRIGVELVDEIVLRQTEAVTKANPKDITKHPDYIRLETDVSKKLKERDREWEGKLALKEAEFKKEKLFEKIKDRALVNLEGRRPILPGDPKKAQVWKETYLNELKAGNYQEGEDGVPIVLDKEGNAMKDKHGNPVSFDEFEKGISDKYFEYPVAQARNGSGLAPVTGQQQNAGDPKTVDECLVKLKDPKITPEDRKKWTDLMDNLNKQVK